MRTIRGLRDVDADAAAAAILSEAELVRYARQLKLLGKAGQKRLKTATVTIAGAGGLGSVSAAYLTAAGIGHIRIVDNDVVELSNLNRQFLHWDDDLGTQKAESFRAKLSCMNPSAAVTIVTQRIDEETVTEIVHDSDAIVDALDNFHTRYLLNRAAVRTGIPYFFGGVQGFEGQVATIIPGKSACLRCIFPEEYPSEPVPVIGPTCGVIGSIQATEVVKYLAGKGELLTDRLLVWDGFAATLETFAVERNPACADCAEFYCSERS